MDLLEHDLTRYIGLQLLHVFTHDDCRTQETVLDDIARHGDDLCHIIQDHPNDRLVTELAVVILAHIAHLKILSLPKASNRQLADMGLRDMLPTMLHVMRSPHPSKSLFMHALMALVTTAQYIPAQCKPYPSLNILFVALLRANDLRTRSAALEGILNICHIDSEADKYEVDLHHLAQSLDCAQPPLASIGVTRENYPQWLRQSDSAHLYRQSVKYMEALSQAARDRDLCELGRTIADIVQRSPSTVEGSWQELEQDVSGRRPSPEFSFSLALPECAKALRLGTPSNRDAADVLDMKYYMLHDRTQEAMALAQQTSSRNPDHPYPYYVISLCSTRSEGLSAAIRGLRCPTITPFLRKQLLWRAVELGASHGFQQILTAHIEDKRAQEMGLANLRTAWRNAQTFLTEAPVDAHLRLTIIGWSFLLIFALRGPELSQNLTELNVSDSTHA